MTRGAGALILLTAVAPIAASQSAPASARPGCRTYSAHETRPVATPTGPAATLVQRCDYNKATNELTCRGDYKSAAVNYSYVTTFVFEKVDDFIGDPTRATYFGHPQRMTMRHTAAGRDLLSRATYSYDGSGRLTRLAGETGGGSGTEEIMTAWDAIGRPTAASLGRSVMSYSYDDARRTATMTNRTSVFTIVKYFDVNGIEIGEEQTSPAGRATNRWTIHATATVCK